MKWKYAIPRLHLDVLDSSTLQMYKQLLLLLLFLQKGVTTDSAWTADWCLAFQFLLVGSSWYKSQQFLGMLLAP